MRALIVFFLISLPCLVHASAKGFSIQALTEVKTDGGALVYDDRYRFCRPEAAKLAVKQGVSGVRLVTALVPLFQKRVEYRKLAAKQIVECANKFANEGLFVVIDMVTEKKFWHLLNSPEPESFLSSEFYPLYKTAASLLYKSISEFGSNKIILELYNEPPNCPSGALEDWTVLQKDLYNELRAESKSVSLLLTGCGGQVDGLISLDAGHYAADANVYYSFHYYEPYTYTHLVPGAGVLVSALPYPPSTNNAEHIVLLLRQELAEKKVSHKKIEDISMYALSYLTSNFGESNIHERFQQIKKWAESHRVKSDRIIMGEYGANILRKPSDMDKIAVEGELRWLHDVSSEADKFGFGRYFWLYPNSLSPRLNTSERIISGPWLRALGFKQPK